jgi:hypothetical protein
MKNGAGIVIRIAQKANKLLPHPYPKAVYIVGANSGNPKAVMLR